MKNQLQIIHENAKQELLSINNIDALRDWEIKYLGRKGKLNEAMRELGSLPLEEKRLIGSLANEIKKKLENLFQEKNKSFGSGYKFNTNFDPTLPGEHLEHGHLHPITILTNELCDVFTSLGFTIEDGPELESDYYNFEALNIPSHHPARDMQDTFYIDKKNSNDAYDLVMRTHTSPVQVRAMQKYSAPLRLVVPGRVFRCEATDATHEHTFNQMEGLMIGENISIANMIATMKELLNKIFKQKMEVRVRPGFFPFVEPGVELDIRCTICKGAKCPACKHSGWLELLPAGMVHPNVLRSGGVDPDKYSGFAFGLGLTRLAMMKYGIGDIRLLQSGNIKFLEQF